MNRAIVFYLYEDEADVSEEEELPMHRRKWRGNRIRNKKYLGSED